MSTEAEAMSVPISHRRVLAIALPIVLSNATVPLLGAVDTAVVGRLGAVEVGAVGLGAIILAFIYGIFNFLRMSTTGLVAQAYGARDEAEAGAHLLRAVSLGLGIGALLVVGQILIFHVGLDLAPASAEVETTARLYLGIRIWGIPATIALFAINGWLIGMARTRVVLVLQLAMNGLNAVLNIVFVLGFHWGVAGVAIASLISEAFGLGFGLWLARGALAQGWAHSGSVRRLFRRDRVVRLVRINGDIMVRSVLLQGSVLSFVFFSAARGDMQLAANQVLLQMVEITAFALDGFAFSAEVLVGLAVGAGRASEVRRATILSAIWGGAGALVLTAIFAIWGGALIDLLTTLPELRAAARTYLPWLVLFPLIGIGSWILDGVFVGATLTAQMRNAMLIATVGYGISILIAFPILGNHGLWLSLLILNVLRMVMMLWWYPAAEAAAHLDPGRSARPGATASVR